MINASKCIPTNAQPDCPRVWSVLFRFLRPKNADTAFWWQATGSVLAEALHQADYPLEEKYACLLFHYNCVAGRLGPLPQTENNLPQTWKSFMTDDFSPIEYSWHWGTGEEAPNVRHSIEPIGCEAGMPSDPFNQQMTQDLVDELRSILPHADWTWFNILRDAFQITPSSFGALDSIKYPSKPPGHVFQSSIFLAFELQRGRPITPKAYFFPIRALPTGEAPLSVITEGVTALIPADHTLTSYFPAYAHLLRFLNTNPEGRLLSVLFLAVDCVSPPEQSRLKI